MEKKITQKLFDGTAKKYDSKHIKNLSSKVIDRMHINDIEQQGITSETMDWFARKKFPVCRYRTQLTIHGTFPKGFSLREGGYKNVFRNGNGSIGVRYTAVDRRKKTRLFALVQFAEPKFWLIENNSTDYMLYHQERVPTADDYKALKVRAEQINTALSGKAFAHVYAYLAQGWGVTYGVLCVNITSFYQDDFGDVLLAIISGHTRYNNTSLLIADYEQHVVSERKCREIEAAAREKEYEQRRREEEEIIRKNREVALKHIEEEARLYGYTHFEQYDCRNKEIRIMHLRSTWNGEVKIENLSVIGKNKISKVVTLNSNFYPAEDWRRPRQTKGTIWHDVWVKEIA